MVQSFRRHVIIAVGREAAIIVGRARKELETHYQGVTPFTTFLAFTDAPLNEEESTYPWSDSELVELSRTDLGTWMRHARNKIQIPDIPNDELPRFLNSRLACHLSFIRAQENAKIALQNSFATLFATPPMAWMQIGQPAGESSFFSEKSAVAILVAFIDDPFASSILFDIARMIRAYEDHAIGVQALLLILEGDELSQANIHATLQEAEQYSSAPNQCRPIAYEKNTEDLTSTPFNLGCLILETRNENDYPEPSKHGRAILQDQAVEWLKLSVSIPEAIVYVTTNPEGINHHFGSFSVSKLILPQDQVRDFCTGWLGQRFAGPEYLMAAITSSDPTYDNSGSAHDDDIYVDTDSGQIEADEFWRKLELVAKDLVHETAPCRPPKGELVKLTTGTIITPPNPHETDPHSQQQINDPWTIPVAERLENIESYVAKLHGKYEEIKTKIHTNTSKIIEEKTEQIFVSGWEVALAPPADGALNRMKTFWTRLTEHLAREVSHLDNRQQQLLTLQEKGTCEPAKKQDAPLEVQLIWASSWSVLIFLLVTVPGLVASGLAFWNSEMQNSLLLTASVAQLAFLVVPPNALILGLYISRLLSGLHMKFGKKSADIPYNHSSDRIIGLGWIAVYTTLTIIVALIITSRNTTLTSYRGIVIGGIILGAGLTFATYELLRKWREKRPTQLKNIPLFVLELALTLLEALILAGIVLAILRSMGQTLFTETLPIILMVSLTHMLGGLRSVGRWFTQHVTVTRSLLTEKSVQRYRTAGSAAGVVVTILLLGMLLWKIFDFLPVFTLWASSMKILISAILVFNMSLAILWLLWGESVIRVGDFHMPRAFRTIEAESRAQIMNKPRFRVMTTRALVMLALGIAVSLGAAIIANKEFGHWNVRLLQGDWLGRLLFWAIVYSLLHFLDNFIAQYRLYTRGHNAPTPDYLLVLLIITGVVCAVSLLLSRYSILGRAESISNDADKIRFYALEIMCLLAMLGRVMQYFQEQIMTKRAVGDWIRAKNDEFCLEAQISAVQTAKDLCGEIIVRIQDMLLGIEEPVQSLMTLQKWFKNEEENVIREVCALENGVHRRSMMQIEGFYDILDLVVLGIQKGERSDDHILSAAIRRAAEVYFAQHSIRDWFGGSKEHVFESLSIYVEEMLSNYWKKYAIWESLLAESELNNNDTSLKWLFKYPAKPFWSFYGVSQSDLRAYFLQPYESAQLRQFIQARLHRLGVEQHDFSKTAYDPNALICITFRSAADLCDLQSKPQNSTLRSDSGTDSWAYTMRIA